MMLMYMALLGCTGSPPTRGLVWSDARPTTEAVPSRFTAALPASGQPFETSHPPLSFVQTRLCSGDADMLDRVLAARAAGTPDSNWDSAVQGLCVERSLCKAVVDRWTTADATQRPFLVRLATGCGLSAVPIFEDPATDEAAVLSWAAYARYQDGWSYVERLGRILRSIEPGEERDDLGTACLFHGRVDDPRVTADLLHVVSSLPEDPSSWTHSAVRGALALQSDPAAVAVHQRFSQTTPDPRGTFKPSKPFIPQFPDIKTRENLAKIGIRTARSIDAEAGRSPPQHDRLLTEMAMVGPSVLTDAVFLQEGGASLSLTAWAGGRRWDATAKATGDWYDLRAVFALLNTMSRDLGSDQRYLVIGEFSNIAVLVAPEPALSAAIGAGLVEPVWDERP